MQEPAGEVPTVIAPDAQEPTPITLPPELMTPGIQAAVDSRMTPEEPVVDEEAQAIARQKIIDNQTTLQQASAEAVEAARTTKESLGIQE